MLRLIPTNTCVHCVIERRWWRPPISIWVGQPFISSEKIINGCELLRSEMQRGSRNYEFSCWNISNWLEKNQNRNQNACHIMAHRPPTKGGQPHRQTFIFLSPLLAYHLATKVAEQVQYTQHCFWHETSCDRIGFCHLFTHRIVNVRKFQYVLLLTIT